MRIEIDTAQPLSTLDVKVLTVLVGEVDVEATPAAKPETVVEDAKKTEPRKKAAPKKVKESKPEPEPEPEPMAEEELVEEEPVEEEPVEEVGEESTEDLLTLAVKKATEMVAGGKAAQVREALDAAGASRVRELNTDNVREFFKALS